MFDLGVRKFEVGKISSFVYKRSFIFREKLGEIFSCKFVELVDFQSSKWRHKKCICTYVTIVYLLMERAILVGSDFLQQDEPQCEKKNYSS